jgi:hypothetical protein
MLGTGTLQHGSVKGRIITPRHRSAPALRMAGDEEVARPLPRFSLLSRPEVKSPPLGSQARAFLMLFTAAADLSLAGRWTER